MLRSGNLKRLLSLLCAFCMVLSLFAGGMAAMASDESAVREDAAVEQAALTAQAPEDTGGELSVQAPTEAQGYDATTETTVREVPVVEDAGAGSAGEAVASAPDQPVQEESVSAEQEIYAPEVEPVPDEEPPQSLDEALEDGEAAELTDDGGTQADSSAETAVDEEEPAGEGEEPADEGEDATDEGEEDDTEPEVPEARWNDAPIVGSASTGGVTVQVIAPEGSFPADAAVRIATLGTDETEAILRSIGEGDEAIGFDISFFASDEQRVQPCDGHEVDLRFSIGHGSEMSDPYGQGATVHVYHIGDDGHPERLASIAAPGQGEEQIDLKVASFSPFVLVKEVLRVREVSVRANRNGAVSTNLADFLRNVVIDAPTDEQGNYVINPNSTYEVTLSFGETESLQFDNESVLTYDFPSGLTVSNVGPTAFSISIVDEQGSATVSDNTFEVVDGQLRVRFNQSDPNFDRLTATSNVRFNVTISSSFDQSVGEIAFNPDIVKDFVYEDNADLTITKHVAYDMDSDTASYTLQITSAGTNEKVVIEDHLTGTALIFNQDVTVESSVNGTLSVTPDYGAVENGFRVTIPQTVNGEVLTLRYTAAVDNTKISSNGTVEQTKNTARVTSDQVPEGKEASADFAGQAKFERVKKYATGDPVPVGENLYEQTWTIYVNRHQKVQMGGADISDWIVQNSRPFMHFNGDGITVNVTFENGATETRVVPWNELYLWQDGSDIWGWRYTTPESDGRAFYTITCTTLIDSSGALGDLTLVNGAQVFGSYDEGKATVGVIGESVFDVQKDAVGTTSTESEWKITVTVPGSGLPEMHVTDDAPKLTYEGQDYIDYFVEDSFEVEGLLEGESWRLSIGTSRRSYTLHFYKSETQDDANKGLLPTPDGQPRDIVIRFKTTVDQDWLDLAANDGYASSNLYRHRNYAAAWSGTYRTPTVEAEVIPIRPELVKDFVERSDVEIDGVTYPVFHYSLAMFGPIEDGIVVHDAFDTTYLRYFEEEGIQIYGGFNYTPTDNNGTVLVTETPDGMDITISSFPKASNGNLYPYYSIEYALIVRDQDALSALNGAAAASQNGVDLENTATWDNLASGSVVNYSYFPYVDKELLTRPAADNGYVAEFKVTINKYAEDLDPTSDVLTIRDILSPNLRFLPDSLVISPPNGSIAVQHDPENNALVFAQVPDETTFEITYRARVLGNGNVTYSNTVQFGKYEKTIVEETNVESSGGGSASNPSITIVKRDAENIATTLAGAVFQLFYLDGDSQVPVRDGNGRDVTFTTGADGRALIVGNQQTLGWTLWEDRIYVLVELIAPEGYEINEQPTEFVLSENPASQLEYDLTGEQLYINNTAIKTSVPVTKRWVGPVGEDVVVHLLANGEDTGKTLTLSANGNWSGSFDNLNKYGDDGGEIRYSVEEERQDNYDPGFEETAEGGFIITNTNTETVRIPVTKLWAGPAAQSATAELFRRYQNDGGTTVETTGLKLVLNEENQWSGSFDNLPRYAPDGTEYQYYVDELAIDGYAVSIEYAEDGTCIITNTNIETIEIPVTKVWVGPAADSVTVSLTADGVLVESAELSADNDWQHTFTDLPKYDAADGHEIEYDAQEEPVEGYEPERSGSVGEGFTFTNTNIETIEIPVTKVWVGPAADSVTVSLTADGVLVESAELNADNNWRHTFADLPKYDAADGHEIEYDVQEEPVEGYEPERSGSVGEGFTFTNTITGKVSIPVTKVWIGPAAESVTVSLTADGVLVESAELNADNNWQHTFTDLPKYSDGEEIAYRIEELELEGYQSSAAVDEEGAWTITNTNIETIEIPVTKVWVGPAAERVTVNLHADGAAIQSAELNADNNWRHTFAGLPKYSSVDGHEIQYTVAEVPIKGYEGRTAGNAKEGFTFTNINISTRSIPVEKRWVGTSLSSVTIRLYADGNETDSVVLSQTNSWKHRFADLPVYDRNDGHQITYTIDEDELSDYTTTITGDMREGFVVTNTKTEEPGSSSGSSSGSGSGSGSGTPKTGDEGKTRLYFLAMALSGGLLVFLLVFVLIRKKRR